MDTSAMYPRSALALLQSSCLLALAMRMRMGVNSEGGISCAYAQCPNSKSHFFSMKGIQANAGQVCLPRLYFFNWDKLDNIQIP